MISVTTDMILKSVLFSLLSGAIFGGIYSFLKANFQLFKSLLCRLFKRKSITGKRSVFGEIFDFFFALTVGAIYILILYAFTDGVFYPISLVALFLGFNLAARILAILLKVSRK